MGRQENADAELPVRLPDELEHLFPAGRVESGGGFVQEDERRIVDQGLRQLHALLHARRISAHGPIAFFEQAGMPQRIGGARAGARRGETTHLDHVGEEFGGAHIARQTVVLRHVPEPGTDADALGRVFPEYHGGARRRPEQAQKDLDGRTLAGAVFTENAGDPVGDTEAHAVEGDDVLVMLREILSNK